MRGEVALHKLVVVALGITPADAERKPPWLRCLRRSMDYPRARGEKCFEVRFKLLASWIIPAYAGRSGMTGIPTG